MKTSKFLIKSVSDNLNILTHNQRELWDLFYKDKVDVKPINKEQISPQVLKNFLPQIWLADLIVEDGKIVDMKFRLIGTKLTSVYGERTGESVFTDTGPNSLKRSMPSSFDRLEKLLNSIITNKVPIHTSTTFFEKNKEYLKAIGIVFPVLNKSEEINMVFGYVEISNNI